MGFPGATAVKNWPVMQETQETWVQSLGGEDPLEEDMAPHSSILAWEIPWTEQPGGLRSLGSQRVGHDWGTELAIAFSHIFLRDHTWILNFHFTLLLHILFLYYTYLVFYEVVILTRGHVKNNKYVSNPCHYTLS